VCRPAWPVRRGGARDVPGADDPVALRLGGGRHYRLQGFAVQRPPLAQIGGFVDPAGRFCAGDPQPVGQRWGQFPAQLGRIGLVAELVDHRMLDGRQPAPHPLAALQHAEVFGGGQCVAPQVQGALELGLERVEDFDDLFPTTRTHVRILTKGADGNRPQTLACG
jgi:hypothetical protein